MPSDSDSKLKKRGSINEIITRLSSDIDDTTGNHVENELDAISQRFDKTLNDALKNFNSNTFDDDGFIKRMRNFDTGDQKEKEIINSVLGDIKSRYMTADLLTNTDLLMRKDLENICTQMPEMRDVITTTRDSIIECNVSSGEVSRSLIFENHPNNETYESEVKGIEERHELQMAIKNTIVPNTLKQGELYVHIVPYAKMFAELELLSSEKYPSNNQGIVNEFRESIPYYVQQEYTEDVDNLYNDANLSAIMESVSYTAKQDNGNEYKIDHLNDTKKQTMTNDAITKESVSLLLKNIEVRKGSSVLLSELGQEAFKEFTMMEYKESKQDSLYKDHIFTEADASWNRLGRDSLFGKLNQDDIDTSRYDHIKGCYIKYLDMLKMAPIKIGKRVIGYVYGTTTSDLQNNAANPNGIVDLSFQGYTRDRNVVDRLANIIIKSFDKKIIERNIKLKNEIAEIIMAHKFSEGKLSFIYIPEDEVVRFVVNEDENGKGHSILEPSLFSAREYLMLNMYNMLYILNNTTTRIHYIKSSGLNKNYAAQIQRTMRKFQSRRITIDDIYSYSGVLNKVGGMGEMVLPAGRNDFHPITTDTIEAAHQPIEIEFLEQQRRQAISGTGCPSLLVINALDEVDFAKTVELANTRYLSAVSSYKIDLNRGLTKMYRVLMKHETDLEPEVIMSFKFMFNAAKQQDLNITADMLANFNSLVELAESLYYSKDELEDEKGNATPKRKNLRKEMAMEYLPQLDFDRLDEVIKRVNLKDKDEILKNKVASFEINQGDLSELNQ